jgi:rare lipoprotein A (peptidoglycan hydrolase)
MQAVKARKHARIGTSVPVKGRLSTGESGKRVVVERRSRHGWKRVADARTREGGNFSARWKTRNVGRFAVRVKAIASPESTARVRGKVTVYRPGAASYYGPGLYGNKLACGGTLQPGTLGVAHKTLPCGTRVTFRYRGRSVAVRVIDRGPYVGGREWDLTEATRNRLRFPSTGTVWSSR